MGSEKRIKRLGRRNFLRTLAGATAFAGITGPFDYLRAQIPNGEQGIRITNIFRTQIRFSKNSPGGWGGVIVRVETNKGIVGYGECRDLDDQAEDWLDVFAPHLVGMNPTKIESIYATMVQLWSIPDDMVHNQERMGTGAISGIEMACWDIVGKVYNVPVYQLLGPRLREKIPMYADTAGNTKDSIERRIVKGFRYFKVDMYLTSIARNNVTAASRKNTYGYYDNTIDRYGLEKMGAYIKTFRDVLKTFGEQYASAPIGSDHYQGYNAPIEDQLSVESAIALATELKKYNNGGYVEDIIDWWIDDCSGKPLKAVKDGADVPVMTGEDMFGFDQFRVFADSGAIDYFHPEPNTFGGINQTLMAARYADSKGIKTYYHNSSGPIAMACYAHVAAATPGFVAMEFHQSEFFFHDDLIDGIEKPMIQNGVMSVPEGPGLGIAPNETQFAKYFADEWTPVG